MKFIKIFLANILICKFYKGYSHFFFTIFLSLAFQAELAFSGTNCINIFNEKTAFVRAHEVGISAEDLVIHVLKGEALVPEFQFIRTTAEKMGLRVWLFGGTASSFIHYVKWDLARINGLMDLQQDRFDYDYTNIFRSTQDLDIVIDGNPEVAESFQKIIALEFPHFLGAKAKWEVRTLRHRMGKPGELGFKEALLNDPDFNNQNTDSNSLGMVELTYHKNEPIVRDLKNWDKPFSVFLDDVLSNRISFFRSEKHFTTSRAKSGENPEILSVIRLLVKAFQYELSFSKADFDLMKIIVNKFDTHQVKDGNALRRIHDTAIKLVMHAVNIEYAMNKLDQLGLRKKLIAMGNIENRNSDAWWLNREPLRSFPVGMGSGTTAAELSIKTVAHETNNFLAYESITRSHTGEPNVLISRKNTVGEAAEYGEGFYTKKGIEGAAGTGLTVRFEVNPEAREGSDFNVVGEYVIFNNKKALKVIPESLNFDLADLLKLAESNQDIMIDHSNLALFEKLKRKLNATKINEELNKLLNSKSEIDHNRLIRILNAFENSNLGSMLLKDVLLSVVKNVYQQMSSLANSKSEKDLIFYFQTLGPIINTLNELKIYQSKAFIEFLDQLLILPRTDFEFRKKVIFEKLLSQNNVEKHIFLSHSLNREEHNKILFEISNWYKSDNPRKVKFAIALNRKWSVAIKNGDIDKIKSFIDSGILKINFKNISQLSLLQLAAYYQKYKLIDWLIQNNDFDFNTKNDLGYNEVEQLVLVGKSKIADEIIRRRPEVFVRKFEIKERMIDGTPLVDFVKIEPGSFLMGIHPKNVLTTITKPFEFMSVHITEEVYNTVLKLLNSEFPGQYEPYNSLFSYGEDTGSLPVASISFDKALSWNQGLSRLSQLEDDRIQIVLEKFFPGHKKGAVYRLPTEAEWEFVARLGGVAEGHYAHGQSEVELREYQVFGKNSDAHRNKVGLKKPVFYNGKPIYDLNGNLSVWTSNWFSDISQGGVDPQGPLTGGSRVHKGGCFLDWDHTQAYTSLVINHNGLPEVPSIVVGFRIVRSYE